MTVMVITIRRLTACENMMSTQCGHEYCSLSLLILLLWIPPPAIRSSSGIMNTKQFINPFNDGFPMQIAYDRIGPRGREERDRSLSWHDLSDESSWFYECGLILTCEIRNLTFTETMQMKFFSFSPIVSLSYDDDDPPDGGSWIFLSIVKVWGPSSSTSSSLTLTFMQIIQMSNNNATPKTEW